MGRASCHKPGNNADSVRVHLVMRTNSESITVKLDSTEIQNMEQPPTLHNTGSGYHVPLYVAVCVCVNGGHIFMYVGK